MNWIRPLLLFSLYAPLVHAAEPGVTAGEFSVDASGAANYSVPIAIPPGTAGMQPSLSLSYNSRSGNGILGVGWTLGGLSVITRCPTTQVVDGFIDGVDFDANDRFCIDGQRLIQVTGSTGEYGDDGIEYRTEVDGFTKVISYDTDGTNNGPEYFIARTKSGQILEYGNTADSRIETQGKNDVRLWAVNKISDTVGNYLAVTYNEDTTNGTYTPIQIDYTGNDNASPQLNPYASVQFEYETRTDITPMYFAGSLVKNTQRLTNIKTYVGSTLVRNYQLTYDNNGAANRSRLTQLEECDGQPTQQCFNSVNFEWPGDDQGYYSNSNFEPPAVTAQFNTSPYETGRGQFVDLNGDGLPDYVQAFTNASGTIVKLSLLNTGNGWQTSTNYELPAVTVQFNTSPDEYHRGQFVDINGDGLTDYMQAFKSASGNIVKATYLNTGNGWQANTNYELPVVFTQFTTSPYEYDRGQFVDLNGDAVPDYIQSFKNASGTIVKSALIARSSIPNALVKITSGLGNVTIILYTSLTGSSVYAKGSGATYPEVDIQGPVYVVSSVDVDDGAGAQRETTYHYSGARSSLDGRGFLGFETMAATDTSTGITTTTTYSQTYPYIGLVTHTEQVWDAGTPGDDTDDVVLGEVDTGFAQTQTNAGIEVTGSHPGVLFPYAATVTKNDYELDGAP